MILLLRHGPTAASGAGAPLGWLDWPVTSAGERRWKAVKTALLALKPELVLTSDLRRCWRHAVSLGLPVRLDRRLREQHFGAWDGVPWDDIGNAGRAVLDDPVRRAPPGGESFVQMAARVKPVWDELLAMGARHRVVLVLASAGPLRVLAARARGLDLHVALQLSWPPFALASVTMTAPPTNPAAWRAPATVTGDPG